MRNIVRVIDNISEYTGMVVRWACLALVLVLCFEVSARYVFNAPTMWSFETASMLGGTIAVLGWSYTHKHGGHVRVDVFYSHLPPRGKAILDVALALLFFFPLLFSLTYIAWDRMWFAWSMGEVMARSNWYPITGPIRTVVVLGLFLFALQGVAQFLRDLYRLTRNQQL
jgi:TRAP-type mannitol/chloroaromatic compound transport system permease small subunit